MKLSAVLFVYFCVAATDAFMCFRPREVCGKQAGTEMCRKFLNICKMNWQNSFYGPQYNQVPISTCQRNAKWSDAPCVGTTTVPPFCDPNVQCANLPTNIICGIQTSDVLPHEEFCRTFRNQCEFNKYHCGQNSVTNPITFATVDTIRCSGLTTVVAACV